MSADELRRIAARLKSDWDPWPPRPIPATLEAQAQRVLECKRVNEYITQAGAVLIRMAGDGAFSGHPLAKIIEADAKARADHPGGPSLFFEACWQHFFPVKPLRAHNHVAQLYRDAMMLLADELDPPIEAAPPVLDRPRYYDDISTLYFRGQVAKRFIRNARNQKLVLTAFEEEGWPASIDSQLPPKVRIHDTVHSLNKRLDGLRFSVISGAERIAWGEC